jgi:soluble lytic murein transglycosylase-like protein
MRYGFILPILASALLTGCFPRLAHYDGDAPAPAPQAQATATPMPAQPAAGPVLADVVPEDRLFAFIVLTNPFLTPAMARQEAEAICRHAREKGVPVSLVASLIATESSFNPKAVSPVGAQGLGQLMPATAKDMGVTDPFDIEQNIAGTTRYIAWLGTVWAGHPRRWEMALASYLAGVGTVSKQLKAGRDLTNEQTAYVKKILNLTGKV